MGLTKKVDLSPIQTQIDTINNTLVDYDSALDGLGSQLTAATAKNGTQDTTLSSHTTTINSHTGTIDTHESRLDGHDTQLSNIDTNLSAYADDLTALQGTNRAYIRREKTGNSSMAANTNQTIFFDWQTRKQGTGVTCTDGTNFVISKAGTYLLNCCLSITDNTVAEGFLALSVLINGNLTRLSSIQYDENGNIALNGSCIRYLTVGTTITFNAICGEAFTAIGLVGEARTYAEIIEL